MSDNCKHPPSRYFTGWAWSPVTKKDELWVACNDCGEVIKEAHNDSSICKG